VRSRPIAGWLGALLARWPREDGGKLASPGAFWQDQGAGAGLDDAMQQLPDRAMMARPALG
jgi:hypothetical protein